MSEEPPVNGNISPIRMVSGFATAGCACSTDERTHPKIRLADCRSTFLFTRYVDQKKWKFMRLVFYFHIDRKPFELAR
jgi:hypothetical protein